MTLPKMKSVFSSHVSTIGYDPESRELHVQYRDGKRAAYVDVPPETAHNVMNAPSIGNALHAHVRGKFTHRYLT